MQVMPIENWGVVNKDASDVVFGQLLALHAKMNALTEPVQYDFIILLQHEQGYGMILGNIVGDQAFACKAYPIGKQWMSEFAAIIGLKQVDDMDGSKL